jgi:hypothetical protein
MVRVSRIVSTAYGPEISASSVPISSFGGWPATQAQKDPDVSNQCALLAGWQALVTVLTLGPMDAIAAALGLTVG